MCRRLELRPQFKVRRTCQREADSLSNEINNEIIRPPGTIDPHILRLAAGSGFVVEVMDQTGARRQVRCLSEAEAMEFILGCGVPLIRGLLTRAAGFAGAEPEASPKLVR
jgi:hypothetical protein